MWCPSPLGRRSWRTIGARGGSMPTKIEWCDETWNPVTGCSPVSEGCRHCYAERLVKRFGHAVVNDTTLERPTVETSTDFRRVTLHPERLGFPSTIKKPKRIFLCSMGDLFHEDVPFDFITRVMDAIRLAPQHTYLILTKRPERARRYFNFGNLDSALPNVWLGVSVEDWDTFLDRIQDNHRTNVAHRFLSIEPCLGPMRQSRQFCEKMLIKRPSTIGPWLRPEVPGSPLPIHQVITEWVIVGGETGPGARKMDPDWAGGVRDDCVASGIPFFFKGWGDSAPKMQGARLDGQEWKQFPSSRGEPWRGSRWNR